MMGRWLRAAPSGSVWCHLQGFRFAPRIRDLKDRRIFTIEKPSRYGDLSPLIGGTVRVS